MCYIWGATGSYCRLKSITLPNMIKYYGTVSLLVCLLILLNYFRDYSKKKSYLFCRVKSRYRNLLKQIYNLWVTVSPAPHPLLSRDLNLPAGSPSRLLITVSLLFQVAGGSLPSMHKETLDPISSTLTLGFCLRQNLAMLHSLKLDLDSSCFGFPSCWDYMSVFKRKKIRFVFSI